MNPGAGRPSKPKHVVFLIFESGVYVWVGVFFGTAGWDSVVQEAAHAATQAGLSKPCSSSTSSERVAQSLATFARCHFFRFLRQSVAVVANA